MLSKKYKLIIAGLLVVVALLSVRVIFDKKFDEFGRFVETRENYKGGPEKFDNDFKGLVDWEKAYKKDHPNATAEEIDKAFKDLWKK